MIEADPLPVKLWELAAAATTAVRGLAAAIDSARRARRARAASATDGVDLGGAQS